MRFKHAFACPRPVELSAQIQPMIPTPGHASWPSGHATEAYMVATMLRELLPPDEVGHEQLQRLAARIAVNRTVAGLHYPVDSAVGRLLGTALGDFFVARCRGGTVHERGFDGPRFHNGAGHAIDFDPRVPLDGGPDGYYQLKPAPGRVAASALMKVLWQQARAEWHPEPKA
jgi:hypothetical protein